MHFSLSEAGEKLIYFNITNNKTKESIEKQISVYKKENGFHCYGEDTRYCVQWNMSMCEHSILVDSREYINTFKKARYCKYTKENE